MLSSQSQNQTTNILNSQDAGLELRLPVSSYTCRSHPFPIAVRLKVVGIADVDMSFKPVQWSFKVKYSVRSNSLLTRQSKQISIKLYFHWLRAISIGRPERMWIHHRLFLHHDSAAFESFLNSTQSPHNQQNISQVWFISSVDSFGVFQKCGVREILICKTFTWSSQKRCWSNINLRYLVPCTKSIVVSPIAKEAASLALFDIFLRSIQDATIIVSVLTTSEVTSLPGSHYIKEHRSLLSLALSL